ncbi:MAG: DUF6498-containing protein [Candidatus Nanoarchaeia archaeon]
MNPEKEKIYSAVFVSIVILVLAIFQHWTLLNVLFIYWMQIIIMLFFEIIRIIMGKVKSGFADKKIKRGIYKSWVIGKLIFICIITSAFIGSIVFRSFSVLGALNLEGSLFWLYFALSVIFIQNIFIFVEERRKKVKYLVNISMLRYYLSVIPLSITIVIFGYVFMFLKDLASIKLLNLIGIAIFMGLLILYEWIFRNAAMHENYDF